MRVAICDDENLFVDDLYNKILEYQKNKNIDFNIDKYCDSKALIDNLKWGEKYDVIFLDICMPEYDGITSGDFIRNKLVDNITQIIYVSANTQYAYELFKFQPLDFLVKPVTDTELRRVMDKAITYVNDNEFLFSFKSGREIYRLELKKIRYIGSEKRKIIIDCDNNERYEYYGKIDEVYDILKTKGFIRIHKSYIVNKNYIRIISANSIHLDNDVSIPISRKWRGDINKICQQYI